MIGKKRKRRAAGILIGLLMLFSAGGCSGADPSPAPDASLVWLGYSCSHMDFSECFSFSISEEEGEVLLDASCFSYSGEESGQRIEFSDVSVPAEEMERLRGLAETYDLAEILRQNKPKEDGIFICDETIYSLCAEWSDGTYLQADSAGELKDSLREFFFTLAIRINGQTA